MGAAEPVGSKQDDDKSAGFHKKRIFASNSGKCVEESYPEGAILLHLGSGSCKWNGWVNVDLDPTHADLVSDIRSLPHPDNHADAIAAIHVVEHIYRWEVEDALKEWHRVLKPGGQLILELPSMEKVFTYITNMMDTKNSMSPTFSWFPLWGDPAYKDGAMVHKWGYTYPMMREILINAGFANVKVGKPRYHFPQRDMRVTASK